ncbi:non-structural maintenance of chromosomes element 1 homolog [Leptonychotes weddellii]|uniref:Non-structural maintenance of chromosomes element 1 homolog n=1 Tax=Leptonychotes weddellii TaxID=9713 RepID=A0A7F8PYX9_LEPWE|nr:non-structural maintenance of chromosomes element 1 homolog [Leptonychotes weddellii]
MEEGRAERRRRTEAPSHPQGGTGRAGVMTDVHRRFLQLLMTHGVLEEWDVQRLQKHCYRVHDQVMQKQCFLCLLSGGITMLVKTMSAL